MTAPPPKLPRSIDLERYGHLDVWASYHKELGVRILRAQEQLQNYKRHDNNIKLCRCLFLSVVAPALVAGDPRLLLEDSHISVYRGVEPIHCEYQKNGIIIRVYGSFREQAEGGKCYSESRFIAVDDAILIDETNCNPHAVC